MDFNLDDPLADILSDGSNDSFFENKTKEKSKSAFKIQNENISKFEDLFGVKDKSKSEVYLPKPVSSDIQLAKKPNISSPSLLQSTKPVTTNTKSESNNFQDDDLLSDLGFDPKKPKSKITMFDDILAPLESKKIPTTPTKTSNSSTNKPFSRQSTETTETSAPGTYAPSLSIRPKTAPRRPSNTSVNDPLGLFGSSSTKETSYVHEVKDFKETPKIKRKGTTADWLGIDLEKKSQKDIENVSESTKPAVSSQNLNFHSETGQLSIPNLQIPQLPKDSYENVSNQRALMMAATNLEAQNAYQTLQYQEAQVTKAAQMKNQEQILIDMQRKQQDLLLQQELQFNELLEKQVYRQNQLERSIRSQQERINAHIQILMNQPETNYHSGIIHENNNIKQKPQFLNNAEERGVDVFQLQNDVKRLELEKIRLEDLVANINTNHEKEMDLITISHKKQIQVLEDNIVIIETRLQAEIKSLQKFYIQKLEVVEEEKLKMIESFEKKIEQFKNDYENRIQLINLQHTEYVTYLTNNHKAMIETIRQSKLLEFSVVQENSSYLETLRHASKNLDNVTGGLETLRDEMLTKIDIENKQRELNLVSREKKLDDSERRLRIFEESSEKEKSRLIELVTSLEIQLSKLSSDSSDEQWNIRQKLSSLEVEKAAFEREKQFTREQFNREDKRIQEIKQFQLEENNRMKQQLQDERQLLLTEKTKLETARKLEETSDFNNTRTEVEAALKVAQDAIRQADLERERFFKKQRELEQIKRDLVTQENEIHSKQEELQSAMKSVKTKETQISGAMQKHRLAEQSFNAKLQMLENQNREINERESYLTQERLVLSRERLDLQELRRKLELNKCSLCRIGERNAEISNILTRNDIIKKNDTTTHHQNYISMDNRIANPKNSISMLENIPNYIPNAIDKLFEKDVTDSLRRMEFLNRDLKHDYDIDTNTIHVDLVEEEPLDSNHFDFH